MQESTKHEIMDAIELIAEETSTPIDVVIEALTGRAFDEDDAGNLKAAFKKYLNT